MKRFAVLPVVTLLLLLLLSSAALAADYDVSTAASPLIIPAGTHTLTGTATDLSIECDPGVTLTLDGVSVKSSGCALSFSGTDNELILTAGTTNTFISNYLNPGISVEDTAVLTISGSGTVTARGGTLASGIGSGNERDAGTIHIFSGTVKATGGGGGAGIGGGFKGDGGIITISGGTVNAYSGDVSAGIGGGGNGSGGIITISGGTVNATGSNGGAGIGGGANGSGGIITISGGTVTATGDRYGAGIGSGNKGHGGSIEISDGIVYAAANATDARDIGYGRSGSGVTFTLSGSAAVFLENDNYTTPTILGTQVHYNPVPFVGNTANYATVPTAWTIAQGAFLLPLPVVPQTGDSSRMGLWIALAGLSAAAVSFALLARRKRRA